MVTKISLKISGAEYVERISETLLKMTKNTLFPLYEDLRTADCIVCGGSGRSLHSLNITMSQIAMMKESKVVITREDVGFPGRGMLDAASQLEKRHKKIVLLINSGSGESDDPIHLAKELEKYLDVSRKDIMNVANKYLNSNERVVLYYLPKSEEKK